MKKLIAAIVSLVALAAAPAAFAGVTQACVDGDVIRVPARAMEGLDTSKPVKAACHENKWRGGPVMTQDASGDFYFPRSSCRDGRFHPVQVTDGKIVFSQTHLIYDLDIDTSGGGTNLKAVNSCN